MTAMVRAPHFVLYSETTSTRPEVGRSTTDERTGGARSEHSRFWHFVLKSPDGQTQLEVADVEHEATEERLTLLAVVRGLEALEQPSHVTLVTTSASIRHTLRFGLDAWRENHWQWERFGRMTPVKNADLWRRVDRALRFHDIDCRLSFRPTGGDDLSNRSRHGCKPSESRQHAMLAPHAVRQRPSAHHHRWLRACWTALAAPHASASRTGTSLSLRWMNLVRRLFGWCGLCRFSAGTVIATP